MNEQVKVKLKDGPQPWAASVEIEWDTVEMGWSRRTRSRRINGLLKDLGQEDYQTRYDNILDVTHIYFRDKADAVTAYFYMS